MLKYITISQSVFHCYCLRELILTLYYLQWCSVGAVYFTVAMHRGVWARQNTFPISVLHDVVLYQGILCSQNVMCYHGTCVNLISFMPVIRAWPLLKWLLKDSQIWQWKIRIWINSGLQIEMSIRCTNCHMTQNHSVIFVDISCTELCKNLWKIQKMGTTFYLHL